MPPAKSTPPGSAALKIAPNSQSHTLNKGQKLFNQLTKKITRLRQQVKQWEELLPRYEQQYQQHYAPLMAEFNRQRLAMLQLLDAAYEKTKLNKGQRQYLRSLIEEMLDELLEYEPNDQLKALFARYHGQNYEDHEQSMQESLRAMMSDVMGVEIDQIIDFRDPEAMLKMMAEQMRARLDREQADADDAAAEGAAGAAQSAQFAQSAKARQPSQRELKRQAEQALAEQQLGQTLREVYRKLASALHPDRETDCAERERKTALMSRVNVAYDNKDLLRLLELQLEVEQIDAAMINSLGGERLKHFNRILGEQVDELNRELQQIYYVFQLRFPGLQPEMERKVPSASQPLPHLMQEVAQLEQALAGLNQDLLAMQDARYLKQWLTGMIAEERQREREQSRAMREFERLVGKHLSFKEDLFRYDDENF